MADYGFEFSNSWVTRVDSEFANYSLIKSFSVSVSTGVRSISLGVSLAEPIIAVRHPGIDVGFLRQVNGNPTKVEIYVRGSGTIQFKVFSPRQVKGNTGWGMLLNDFTGREVYHSDLFYLDVNNFVSFGTSLGSGYYILGSYRGMNYEFEDESSSWVNCTDWYGYEYIRTCDFVQSGGDWVYQCDSYYNWPDGYEERCYWTTTPYTYDYVCTTELVYVKQGTSCIWTSDFAVRLRKTISCVRQTTNNILQSVNHIFWNDFVYSSGSTGSSYDSVQGYGPNGEPLFDTWYSEFNAEIQAGIHNSGLAATFDPQNVSSQPNKLLVSPMDYV